MDADTPNTSRRTVLTLAALAAALPWSSVSQAADGKLYVIAELVAKKGQEDSLRTALVPFAQGVPAEPGCLSYHLHEDLKQPGRFLTYEIWQDAAALKAHFETPAMKAAGPKLMQILDKPLAITNLRLLV